MKHAIFDLVSDKRPLSEKDCANLKLEKTKIKKKMDRRGIIVKIMIVITFRAVGFLS